MQRQVMGILGLLRPAGLEELRLLRAIDNWVAFWQKASSLD
jgi:hypothetical protein